MLLIQSLSALDCQEFSSPRRDSGFITQPQLPRRVPSAWIFHDGSCHPALVPIPVPVPEGWPWIKAPTAVQGMGDSTVPEPELHGDLRAGVLLAVTIWPISGRRHPLPALRQLLGGH